MADPLSPYHWLEGPGGHPRRLGGIYCVSFFRELAPAEVLHRFGPDEAPGQEMTFDQLWDIVGDFTTRTQGGSGSGYVGVRQARGWSVAIELLGWYAVLPGYHTRLSEGCEMIAISRHDYAEDSFVYAADGELLTGFTPHMPSRRWGSDPNRINPIMHEFGMPTETLNDEEWEDEDAWDRMYEHRIARVFALAAELTGVAFTPSLLDEPLLVGAITQLA
ncbi:DUF6461 domain-containing protein [Actinomadura sp. B10D3]|uniref:DUF6461 domain-containing protein n=1 Tax=Actinomadura sp. B10D3 TaxID=3153557 RepID=UPI00325E9309